MGCFHTEYDYVDDWESNFDCSDFAKEEDYFGCCFDNYYYYFGTKVDCIQASCCVDEKDDVAVDTSMEEVD